MERIWKESGSNLESGRTDRISPRSTGLCPPTGAATQKPYGVPQQCSTCIFVFASYLDTAPQGKHLLRKFLWVKGTFLGGHRMHLTHIHWVCTPKNRLR